MCTSREQLVHAPIATECLQLLLSAVEVERTHAQLHGVLMGPISTRNVLSRSARSASALATQVIARTHLADHPCARSATCQFLSEHPLELGIYTQMSAHHSQRSRGDAGMGKDGRPCTSLARLHPRGRLPNQLQPIETEFK
jgi:hypothetical protein